MIHHRPNLCTPSPHAASDDLYRQAEQLPPDERLRLVSKLWYHLPPDHKAAFDTLQQYNSHNRRAAPDGFVLRDPSPPLWPKLRERFFAPDNASGLYSAPRRFDLATIFVVTAAYSLMLGGLTGMGMPPLVKVVITAMVTIVAATQALFLKVANPRGVSIVTGAIAYTVISWCIWMSVRYVFPNSFFFVTFINGILGGAILGYLLGTLVGGVFLVADKVRQKFDRRAQSPADESTPPRPPPPTSEPGRPRPRDSSFNRLRRRGLLHSPSGQKKLLNSTPSSATVTIASPTRTSNGERAMLRAAL